MKPSTFPLLSQSFLGITMSQVWNDLYLWENFFNDHPIKTLIELGTGSGGLSTFFALQCLQRGIEFHTFDNQQFYDFTTPLPALLNIHTHHIDIFSAAGQLQVLDIILTAEHPLALFFDNGDKPREWSLFAEHTQPGDFCIVHDWKTEFHPKDTQHLPVEPLLAETRLLKPPSHLTMFFKRLE